MRTIEEAQDWVRNQLAGLELLPPDKRGEKCLGCLHDVLNFIESEPPCDHKFRFHIEGDPERPTPYLFTYCPDCGTRLAGE